MQFACFKKQRENNSYTILYTKIDEDKTLLQCLYRKTSDHIVLFLR